ncbi:MAG: AraC family transcriptional regulator [Qingshengfaniella sp.]
MKQRDVPTYGLFGEDRSFADVLHCERVSARAPLYDWAIALHRHAGIWQVLAVFEGGGELAAGGETRMFGANVAILVPAGLIHGYRFHSGTRGIIVSLPFGPDQGSDGAGRMADGAIVVPLDTGLDAHIRDLEAEYLGRAPGRATALLALAQLIRLRITRAAVGGAAGRLDSARVLFQRLIDMVDRHLAEPLGVADYAERLAVSPTHLSRVCRGVCGVSAQVVIRERRMAEARALLAHTDMRVSAVAYAVGYPDPNHFSRAFRDYSGAAPKAFRLKTRRSG